MGTKKHAINNDDDSQGNTQAFGVFGVDSFSYADSPVQENIFIHYTAPSASSAGSNEHVALSSVATSSTGVPANAYYGLEWQLNGTWGLHTQQVWNDYTGAGQLVTDLDDGFQTNLPDFGTNYNVGMSYDFVTNTADGAAAGASDNHGTAVMSEIIGTGDNGNGSVGVAYAATAFGMRMGFSSGSSLYEVQESFQYAQSKNVDAMNNSWGFSTEFGDDFGAVDGSTYFSGIAGAMKSFVDHDRGGLGGAIVFAAGNAGETGDNTNYHNMQNSPYVITVAAIAADGTIAPFSTNGTSILVSAAGVNDVAADKTGAAGYVNGDYIYFSGTSAAAPLVSGTVALMLQANSNLGWRDIQTILAYSAQYNDPSNSSWEYNGATNWNGGGLHFSSDFGFGAANALAAVRLAETWTLQNGPADSANMVTVSGGASTTALAISASVAASTINVSQNINVEHVEVNLNIADTNLTGLTVTLVAPDGTKSVLINDPSNGTGANSLQFQTETNADWGETSAGQWKLLVQDTATGATGTLNGWSLTFLGSAVSPNHTYIYTDDFGNFSGTAQTARSIIQDSGGGIDTLNLAAVTSGSTINLTAGTGTIAGHAVTIAHGTTVNNVYGGDGNDSFTGNANDDYLYGGRGNDKFTIMGGHDTVNGGAGTDTVVYSEAISNFHFTFTSATEQTITDTVGTLDTDLLTGIEDFYFAGTLYTLQQLENYVTSNAGTNAGGSTGSSGSSGSIAGGSGSSSGTGSSSGSSGSTVGGSSGSSSSGSGSSSGGSSSEGSGSSNTTLDDITLTFPGGHVLHSTTAASQIFASRDLGGTGPTLGAEITRDSTGITVDYLSATAPKTVTISAPGSHAETIDLAGTAPSGLKDTITVGNASDTIDISVTAASVIHAGHGDNNITIGTSGASTIVVGNGTNSISLGNGNETVTAGTGANTIQAGNGVDKIILGSGNNHVTLGSGKDSVTAGNGNNSISVGDGTDVIHVGNGNNTISAGSGHNTIAAGGGSNTISVVGGVNAITVGSGNNAIYGGHGTGTITLGNGTDTVSLDGGHYTINAGHGKDAFIFTAVSSAATVLNHFSISAGDTIDISDVLSQSNPSSQALSHYVEVVTQGRNTAVLVDTSGSGSHFTTVAVISGVTHLTLDSLISNNNLIV